MKPDGRTRSSSLTRNPCCTADVRSPRALGRLGFGQSLAAMVVLCSGWVAAGPAGRADSALLPSVDLVCTASAQINFSPPLNNDTVSGSVGGYIQSCTSPDGRAAQIRSGAAVAPDTPASGCSPLGLTVGGNGTISWSNGTTSDFTIEVSTHLSKPPLGFGVILTGGTLAGDRVIAVPLLIDQDGLCGFGGVRDFGLPLAVVIVMH